MIRKNWFVRVKTNVSSWGKLKWKHNCISKQIQRKTGNFGRKHKVTFHSFIYILHCLPKTVGFLKKKSHKTIIVEYSHKFNLSFNLQFIHRFLSILHWISHSYCQNPQQPVTFFFTKKVNPWPKSNKTVTQVTQAWSSLALSEGSFTLFKKSHH